MAMNREHVYVTKRMLVLSFRHIMVGISYAAKAPDTGQQRMPVM